MQDMDVASYCLRKFSVRIGMLVALNLLYYQHEYSPSLVYCLFITGGLIIYILLLTQNRANTLECASTCERSSKRSTPAKPLAGRSDLCKQGVTRNLEQRAQEGPRRSSRG